MHPYDPTVAEAKEEAITEAAEKHGRGDDVLKCECGGRIEWDQGSYDTRHEPGTPPCWYCCDCGESWKHHPAIARAFIAGAKFFENATKDR